MKKKNRIKLLVAAVMLAASVLTFSFVPKGNTADNELLPLIFVD